ncbi:MAG: alkaline phosphatase family protein [Acidobacteriaceae bacterium]|jgi:arylsulfatase A-like enzyme
MQIRTLVVLFSILAGPAAAAASAQRSDAPRAHNIILFVADGLRRNSVSETDTPALARLRKEGVDFRNSHSVFPTFTTANASVIATGHGLGDTGDYSNTIYPGMWLTHEDTPGATGALVPFLENDEVLANMNDVFHGNYLGEKTLLGLALEKGMNVASVGKLGPSAIQLNDYIGWNQLGLLDNHGAIVIDDSTGQANAIPLPLEIVDALSSAKLPTDAPLRTNGFSESSAWSNAHAGDAATPGTLEANRVQQQWFADVATKVLLPKFAGEDKPFVLVFWSRDPDGTQHNEGDSLQRLTPGINGDTARLGLQNADRCLKQLLDWLDAHPKVKATTDVIVTSDHGFATISRREIAKDGTQSTEPSANLDYEAIGQEKPEPQGTLPTGFLAVDLAIRAHMRLYDPAIRATGGPSVFAELTLGGEKSHHPATGSALLGETVKSMDGSDAKVIVASNGGSDLLYVPSGSAEVVHSLLDILTELDYVGGVFVDDRFCVPSCAGALPLSAIGLVGDSNVPRPAIVVTFKFFYQVSGDLQSAVQVSDTPLQEGQGNHGGFGRDQTLNNMAAIGPDFKVGFADELPVGNIDLAPTMARILGIDMPPSGKVRGRVLQESLIGSLVGESKGVQTLSSPPTSNGVSTILEYQEFQGVRYYDSACLVDGTTAKGCL